MELIESKTLGTAAASIEFTSIPQDGTDLLLLVSVRTSVSQSDDSLDLFFNGADSNRTVRVLYGTGSAVASGTNSNDWDGWATAANNTANTFSNISYYIPNYTGSTNKSYSIDSTAENNATYSLQAIVAGLWSQTAAVTSIGIKSHQGSNLVAGSTISLYKITKGSDGIVTTS